MDLVKFEKSTYKAELRNMVKLAENIRTDKENPYDISLKEIVKKKFGVEMDGLFDDLGINPSVDTIANLFTLPDDSVRWLVPEIIREALLVGYRAAPIWPNITALEETTTQLSQIIPSLNMSDAAPAEVKEGETIPVGTLSYQQKKVTIFKVGRGIKIPYEVSQYCSLNVISVFLRDFGIKLGHALDVLALNTIINGEQTDGSESAPVVGVQDNTIGGQYKDLLKVFVRMARIGRLPDTIIADEDSGINTLDMKEFKWRVLGLPVLTPMLKTPVPAAVNYYIHGNIPANQQIIVDPKSCLIKLNAIPLNVESERIVSNQTNAFYASLTTGFAKLFRDSAVIMDSSINFLGNGFPNYMNVDALQNVVIE